MVATLLLVASLLTAIYARCCTTSIGGGAALARVVETGLPGHGTADHHDAVAPTSPDPMLKAWAEDRGAGARLAALVVTSLALAVMGPLAGPAVFPRNRRQPCAFRRRHSISLRAPPRLGLTL